jgi:alpha/beta superfamily hydrolase
MSVGVEAGASGLLGLGTPYRRYDFAQVARCAAPKAFVLADGDEFTSTELMGELVSKEMRPPSRLWVVPGTSHLFVEDLDGYEKQVSQAGRWLLEHIGV